MRPLPDARRFGPRSSTHPYRWPWSARATSGLYANPSLCRLTGYRADQLGRLTVAELTHPDDRDARRGAGRRPVADGSRTSSTVEARLLRPDGRTVWAQSAVRPVRRRLA